jgi:hypothetical protein
MKLDKLTKSEREDEADYFRERVHKNSTTLLQVKAVIQHQLYDDTVKPAPTKVRELMEFLWIVLRIVPMLEGTSWP